MNWSALEQQIVDEVQIYIAPKIFGGSAKSPVSGQGVAFPNDALCSNHMLFLKWEMIIS